MATTTNGDGKSEAVPYTEADKLGPLGTQGSVLRDPAGLRTALLKEFARGVQAAKDAVIAVDRTATTAVHDARKGLRRARAVLELVSGALPKSERRAVGTALQEARRALSTIRDHAVAPETLGALTLGDRDRATAKRILDNAAEALPAISEIKQLVAETAARAAAQGEALAAALPAEIELATLIDGIRAVYAEARHAHASSKKSKAWFHVWRRRAKELGYQLELLASHSGARLAAIHSEIDGLTDTLGPAVDLIMVREFISTYNQGVSENDLEHLRKAIDAALSDLMKDTRKAGRDLFAMKPKKLAKRLQKAIKRDLTPTDDHDPHEDLA